MVFVPGDPADEPQQDPNGRVLTPAQLQQQLNARAAAARNAEQPQNPQNPQNPPDQPVRGTAPTTTPTNPFFQGPSGAPGQVAPVPQQNRNPLRPNGDPEP